MNASSDSQSQSQAYAEVRDLYMTYYNTPDATGKSRFYAPSCRQICRTDPSYAASSSEGIVGYLQDAGERFQGLILTSPDTKGYLTVRPLTAEEGADFGELEHVLPAGYASVEEVRGQAEREGWVGMRVDLWQDDGRATMGLMVKVQYWWRREKDDDGAWKQVLHDILYLGKVDGTQGTQGEVIVAS